jgi:hypothetical protein
MLNAGFTTLETLKSRLLPEAARIDTTYDSALSQLGLAIARRFETHCARKLDRLADAVDEFSAWTLSVVLRRYPVETITSVEIRGFTGALEPCETDYSQDDACGLIEFHATPGTLQERLVITYNGGYWLDAEDGVAMPAGATPLPEDLLELWLAEVQLHAEARGTFEAVGLRAQKDADKAKLTNGLSENAVDGLRSYRRFSGE